MKEKRLKIFMAVNLAVFEEGSGFRIHLTVSDYPHPSYKSQATSP